MMKSIFPDNSHPNGDFHKAYAKAAIKSKFFLIFENNQSTNYHKYEKIKIK